MSEDDFMGLFFVAWVVGAVVCGSVLYVWEAEREVSRLSLPARGFTTAMMWPLVTVAVVAFAAWMVLRLVSELMAAVFRRE